MHVFPEKVAESRINDRVVEKLLLPREESSSKMVEVRHLVVAPRGEVEIPADKSLEYVFYVVSGRGLMQGDRTATRGRILYTDTALWAPGGGFVLSNSGEGDMRILLISTEVKGEHYKFARIRMKNFHQAEVWSLAGYRARPFFKEEDLVIAGTLRVHGMDVETLAPEYEAAPHTDPEEVLYVLRGEGEILSEGERKKVYPGTLCHHEAGTPHAIWNTSRVDEMQYMVIEFEDARERFAPLHI